MNCKKINILSTIFNCREFEGGRRGFTIVELLIAMAIASIVAMSGFALFNSSNKSYMVQEGVGEAQQNARAGMNRVMQDLRLAGFGLPKPFSSIEIGRTGPPADKVTLEASLTVTDNEDGLGPDSITILGIGFEAGILVGTNNQGQQFLCYSSFFPPNKEKIIGTNNKVIEPRRHISVDGVFNARLSLNTDITTLSCTRGIPLPLESPNDLKSNLKSGKVYILQAVKYSIVSDTPASQPPCTEEMPCLKLHDYSTLRGAGDTIVAEGIEDLQFSYGIDKDGDGELDDMSLNGTFSADDYVHTHALGNQILAVKVTLVAKTANKDLQGRTFTRPEIENHLATGVADGYRRRILTRIVKIRN